MTDIVWETPPASKHSVGVYTELADALRGKPGEWARVKTFEKPNRAGSFSQAIRKGKYAGFTAGDFEAVSRTISGKGVVYVRYIGDMENPDHH